jgi:excisionase family DNA binding protein
MGFTPEAIAAKTPLTRVLSLEQAAEYMGMTRDSLKHNYDLGRIKAVRVDKKLRFDRIDLDAWIDAFALCHRQRGGREISRGEARANDGRDTVARLG